MAEWIGSWIDATGVFGIAVLMFVENIFPPIPSELIMPLAGYFSAQGEVGLVPAILAGTVGSLAGATVWFVVGLWFGADRLYRLAARLGRVLTLTPQDIAWADAWFDRHGHWAVLFGRLVPAGRTVISIPAGISGMRWTTFVAFSFVGTLLWTALLTTAGYLLGNRADIVEGWVGPVSNLVVVVAVAIYVWRFATYPRRIARAAARAGRED